MTRHAGQAISVKLRWHVELGGHEILLHDCDPRALEGEGLRTQQGQCLVEVGILPPEAVAGMSKAAVMGTMNDIIDIYWRVPSEFDPAFLPKQRDFARIGLAGICHLARCLQRAGNSFQPALSHNIYCYVEQQRAATASPLAREVMNACLRFGPPDLVAQANRWQMEEACQRARTGTPAHANATLPACRPRRVL